MHHAPQFIYWPLDGSTTQRWVVKLILTNTHTHPSTCTFTSDKKDACRCFHDSELYYTASVLHEKETDTEMERWCCIFVAFFFFFLYECACAQLCASARESISREREGGSQQRPAGASLHQQAGCLRYCSRFCVWTSSNLHRAHPIQGAWTEVDSHHHQQSHQWPPKFEEEVINFLIEAKLLCHSDRACCWEGEQELIKMLSAHTDSLLMQLLSLLRVFK